MDIVFTICTAMIALALVIYWIIEAFKFIFSLFSSLGECDWALNTSNEKVSSQDVQ